MIILKDGTRINPDLVERYSPDGQHSRIFFSSGDIWVASETMEELDVLFARWRRERLRQEKRILEGEQ